jgi:hypothetical protein
MPTDSPWGQQALTYHAREDRRMLDRLPIQPGVVAAGDFKVTPVSALTVAAAAGDAWVGGSHSGVVRQGLYPVGAGAAENVTATAAHATLPRIDQVVLRVRDTVPAPAAAGDAENTGQIEIVTGTATAGATLDNRTGAAALPASSLLLADLLVPAAFTGPFVAGTHIRDRRPAAMVPGSTPPVFIGYRAAPHTMTAATWGKIPVDTVEEDAWGWWDSTNNRWIPRTAGLYEFSARVEYNDGTGGVYGAVAISKNGTRVASTRWSNSDPSNFGGTVTTRVRANGTTDYFEMWGLCEGGRSIVADREHSAFEGRLVTA